MVWDNGPTGWASRCTKPNVLTIVGLEGGGLNGSAKSLRSPLESFVNVYNGTNRYLIGTTHGIPAILTTSRLFSYDLHPANKASVLKIFHCPSSRYFFRVVTVVTSMTVVPKPSSPGSEVMWENVQRLPVFPSYRGNGPESLGGTEGEEYRAMSRVSVYNSTR